MASWRIYYGDGSTYSDDDGDVFDAPALDVQAIAFRTSEPDHKTGHMPVFRFDYYWWEPNGDWYGGDLFGLYDYLTRPGPKKVVFGRTVSNTAHQACVDAACNSREFAR